MAYYWGTEYTFVTYVCVIYKYRNQIISLETESDTDRDRERDWESELKDNHRGQRSEVQTSYFIPHTS